MHGLFRETGGVSQARCLGTQRCYIRAGVVVVVNAELVRKGAAKCDTGCLVAIGTSNNNIFKKKTG